MKSSKFNLEELKKHWQIEYQQSKDLLDNLDSLKAFVGFNMDIDFIYKLDGGQLSQLISKKEIREEVKLKLGHSQPVVEELTDFLAALLDSIDNSAPNEVDVANKKVRDRIKKLFKANKKSVGGQAGIISNFLVQLGVDTVVYTPVLSYHQVKYLEDELLYPQVVDDELVLDNISSCINARETKNNLVFEYSRGLELPRLEITAAEGGRFILSDFLTDFSVLLPSQLMQKSRELFERVDRAIVSGYHDLAGKNFYSRLRRAGDQLEKIKKDNPDLKFHLELASQKNRDLENEIVSNVADKVHSVGFDSEELPQVLTSLEEYNLAAEVKAEDSGLFQVWQAMKAITSKLDLERCQLHCDKYLVVLARDDYAEDSSRLRNSLLLGGNSAVAKASKGSIPGKEAVKEEYESSLSDQGLQEMVEFREELDLPEQFLQDGSHRFQSEGLVLVVVPTLLARETKTLVGLGDVISTASFISELA